MVTKHSTLVLEPEPEPKTKTKPKPKLYTRRKKNRTKLRKPKYLSLRLQLTATTPMPTTTTSQNQNHDENKLINFFPLHPENLMEQDKLDVSCIFSSCDDDQANTTLTGILCSDDDEDIEQKVSIDTDKNSSPSSVNYADEERNLVRTAMRRNIIKNEQDDHEKWVSYNEVVDRNKVVMRGMSSSSSSTTSCYYNNHHHHVNGTTSDHGHVRNHNNNNNNKLVLKLDYEKIMKSWVNKGPLYISGLDDAPPQPQTVPDIRDDDFFFPTSINGSTHDERDIGGNDGSLWTVPQLEGDDALRVAGSSAVVHNREASVQRYKEKRRNRLFAKTIRYEVRKLNAEKRPRIKGRFVKRD